MGCSHWWVMGGDTISAWHDATLPNHVAVLNQRKHCNLVSIAENPPNLLVSQNVLLLFRLFFHIHETLTLKKKREKRNEKMKGLHTWMLKCSLLIPRKQLCGFSSCDLIKSSVSGKLTSLICLCNSSACSANNYTLQKIWRCRVFKDHCSILHTKNLWDWSKLCSRDAPKSQQLPARACCFDM